MTEPTFPLAVAGARLVLDILNEKTERASPFDFEGARERAVLKRGLRRFLADQPEVKTK